MPYDANGSGSFHDYDQYYGDNSTRSWVYRGDQGDQDTYDQTYQPSSRRTQPSSSRDHRTQDYPSYNGSYRERDETSAQQEYYDRYGRGDEEQSRHRRRERRGEEEEEEEEESRFSWKRAAAAAAVVGVGMYAMKRIDDDYEKGLKELRKADEEAQRRETRRLQREREAAAAEARYQEEEAERRRYDQYEQEKEERRRRRRLGY
jgi:hypothetical protein